MNLSSLVIHCPCMKRRAPDPGNPLILKIPVLTFSRGLPDKSVYLRWSNGGTTLARSKIKNRRIRAERNNTIGTDSPHLRFYAFTVLRFFCFSLAFWKSALRKPYFANARKARLSEEPEATSSGPSVRWMHILGDFRSQHRASLGDFLSERKSRSRWCRELSVYAYRWLISYIQKLPFLNLRIRFATRNVLVNSWSIQYILTDQPA